ncbi:Multidrug resistance protein MdtE precursor [Leminorella richardii]|uniref:Multidrug resistance protein MdtE n=1 Tax=Leminorella richardii TaxID=158841 RepID=A0A2X4V2N8_9GAMM|nr:MdtA/MuxA family multidrug efflux RND transporter periplasmic adaptor subunit [Leminorella richardii]SQI41102.1 Multidrug resistance protein MdtE precursor [Leminorella richardii]
MTKSSISLSRPLIVTIVVVCTVGAFFFFKPFSSGEAPAVTKSGSAKAPAPTGRRNMPMPPVQAATASIQDVPRYLSGLGTVTASNTVVVRNRVDGQIIAIHFTEGQNVNEGDLLVEIDPRPFDIQRVQAEGQLQTLQATLANAKRDLARYQSLIKTNMISRQQLDEQSSLVKQTEGSIKAAQGTLDNANLQLTYSKVTAPISGRVGLRQVDVGNYVSSGDSTGLVVITQTKPIDVLFSLPEASLDNILPAYRDGKVLTVESWDRENKRLIATGTLLSLDNQIDTATGTLRLKARFDNQDERLFPNQFVNTKIQVDTLKDALIIPAAAVQTGNGENFVWVLSDENKVKKQTVTIGLRYGELSVINSGLSSGQRVVTDGVDRLKEDVQVEIVTPGTPKESSRRGQKAK